MARKLGSLALMLGVCLSLMGSAYPLAQEVEQQENRWWIWVLVALVLLALAAYLIWWWLNPKEETKATASHRAEDVVLPGVRLPEVEAPAASLPRVDLPEVALPRVEVPDVELPQVELPDVDLPQVGLPDVDLPKVELPDVDLPQVELPDVDLPQVELPDVDLPKVALPDVELPTADLPVVRTPEVTLPDFEPPQVTVPGLGAIASRAPAVPDDLKVIEGIGPKIAGVLNAAGIVSFQQLADLSPARILEILGNADPRLLRLADPATWPQQARLAAAGAWDELQKLTDQLKGGRQA